MKNFNSLNKYLSDVAVMNAKLHNIHWNVVGSQFKGTHEYIESLYDFMFEAYDEVAELIKQKNAFPLVKLSDFIANSGITELDSEDFEVKAALKIVLEDIKYMNAAAAAIREESSEDDDFMVSNLMEDHMSAYAKDIWFLNATLK